MKNLVEFDECARRLKALADRERLRIVQVLFAGPQNVSDLAEQLKDEIVKVSHHLGVLRNAGLVKAEKQGRFVVYTLHPDVSAGAKAAGDQQGIDLGCCRLEITPDSPAGRVSKAGNTSSR